ncbi:rho GTPase-activating protein 20-like isoform X2 [Mirounga leonina]|uniref:rho GTPase-activating protein 20-like isoform X2 n=1 Tax=Mirounga leonina TaxID=9715 RepID=UPI00156C384E|nr:rho GTPase-activating protein 20-like isoform X2 [Mirounga leonina]
MSHLPSTTLLPQTPEDSISPSTLQESLLLEQGFAEMQGQFILKPRHPTQNEQGRDYGQKTLKSRFFRDWACCLGSSTSQHSQCTTPPSSKPGQLFGVSLMDVCDKDNLPLPILDFLRNIPGSIFLFNLYEKWLGVIDQGNEEEKMTAARRLLAQLPRANVVLLRYLFGVLYNIEQHSSSNQMTAYNLSVCIAPSVLYPPDSDSLELEDNLIKKVMRALIFVPQGG